MPVVEARVLVRLLDVPVLCVYVTGVLCCGIRYVMA